MSGRLLGIWRAREYAFWGEEERGGYMLVGWWVWQWYAYLAVSFAFFYLCFVCVFLFTGWLASY